MPRVKIRVGRTFRQASGEGDNRKMTEFTGGQVVDVTEAQLRNFADLFEDPNAAVSAGGAENLTAEEAAALAEFRAKKAKEAEAEAAKAKTPDPAAKKVAETEAKK
jgi:hypothetical protein